MRTSESTTPKSTNKTTSSGQHKKIIDTLSEKSLPDLLMDYRQLHAAPELSHQEKNTAAHMATRLQAMGYEVIHPFGRYNEKHRPCYGVVAVLRQGEGPCVLYRADMDALPIEEKTGLPFASRVRMKDDNGKTVPVMHACGHDLHCALLLGIAGVLMQLRAHWRGTMIFIAQPGEESSDGAEAMLRAGLYEKFALPDYALAVHVHDSTPAGRMKYLSGYAFAGVNSIDLIVRGIGGHGAYPEKCVDPVVLSAQIILALQTVISRTKSALDPAVITVGSIHGGTRRNIIPEEVLLEMTVRTYKQEVKEKVLTAIERIARGAAVAAGLPKDRYPLLNRASSLAPVYNSPQLVRRCSRVLKSILGAANVSSGEPTLGAEDFSCYALDGRIPAALFWLGVADPEALHAAEKSAAFVAPIHSPEFRVMAEPALRTGLRAMTAVILDLLKRI
ncbi:amidohydrolase [candidate division KSB1 bacterium]|nr:amidohydrolase [candidate division KSB1 bacterium]